MTAQPTSSSSGRLSGRPVLCWMIVRVFARQSRSPSSRLAQVGDPQAEPGGHQDHRVVALAGGGLAVDHGQQPPDLLSGPQVRLGLVAQVPVRRQPAGQALRSPARVGQEGQEVRQGRPHARDGLAPQPALPQQEARHVPHAEGGQVTGARLVQVAQEPADHLALRDQGRLGVATRPARGNVVVPEQAEPGRAAVLHRDHRPVDDDRPACQRVRHQHHRPTDRLDIPARHRLPQRPQPGPGLVGDEVHAHLVARRAQASSSQEGRETVQHRLVAPDGALRPPGRVQHRHDAAHSGPDICLSHENHPCSVKERTR